MAWQAFITFLCCYSFIQIGRCKLRERFSLQRVGSFCSNIDIVRIGTHLEFFYILIVGRKRTIEPGKKVQSW